MSGTAPKKPEPVPPCAMVIFGGGGDLTQRLVVPALYNLAKQDLLPERFAIIGAGRSDFDDESWSRHLHDFLEQMVKSGHSEFEAKAVDPHTWQKLAGCMHWMTGDFTKPELFTALKDKLTQGVADV